MVSYYDYMSSGISILSLTWSFGDSSWENTQTWWPMDIPTDLPKDQSEKPYEYSTWHSISGSKYGLVTLRIGVSPHRFTKQPRTYRPITSSVPNSWVRLTAATLAVYAGLNLNDP